MSMNTFPAAFTNVVKVRFLDKQRTGAIGREYTYLVQLTEPLSSLEPAPVLDNGPDLIAALNPVMPEVLPDTTQGKLQLVKSLLYAQALREQLAWAQVGTIVEADTVHGTSKAVVTQTDVPLSDILLFINKGTARTIRPVSEE